LRDLWASPKAKDKLRRRNRNLELLPSYPENTDALDQYLQANDDADDELDEESELDVEIGASAVRRDLKRKREVFEEIVVQDVPPGFEGETSR